MRTISNNLCIALLCVACAQRSASAGVITHVYPPATELRLPSPTLANNDGDHVLAFPNLSSWDLVFTAPEYIDVVINVSDSGGTTEYIVFTDLHMPAPVVGSTLMRFEIQIRGNSLPLGLNFDTDDVDFDHIRSFQSSLPDLTTDRSMKWDNIKIEQSVPSVAYELDIPDSSPAGGGSYSFTLRYLPIVPEPSTGICWLATAGMLGLRRRRHRFSNQR